MLPASIVPQLPYLLVILAAFISYGVLVRREVFSGPRIWQGGLVVGIFAVIVSLMNDHQNMHLEPGMSPSIYLMNPAAMAICAGYCVALAYRMQRTEDFGAYMLGDTKIIIRSCPASKLPDAQALILPNTTYLRMVTGVPGQIRMAAGESVEKEAMKDAPVGIGKVVETSAGKLAVGNIYHVAVHEPGKPVKADVLKRFVGQAVLTARKAGAESICIVVGTYPGMTTANFADTVAEAILKQRKSFPEIVFAALDARDGKDTLAAVKRAIQAIDPGAVTAVPPTDKTVN